MRGIGKRFLVLLLALVLCLGSVMTVSATGASVPVGTDVNESKALEDLIKAVQRGKGISDAAGNTTVDKSGMTYKTSEGGYISYLELTGGNNTSGNVVDTNFSSFSTEKFQKLTSGQKQDFLEDMMEVAYDWANYSDSDGVDDTTIDNWLQIMSNKTGMGSSMLAALMSDTKPNYGSANKIWQPFNGIIGTVLALLSIAVMALVGVTMAMDIFYITIPAFQLICSGEGEGGGDGKKGKGIGGIISADAKAACSEKDNGNCTSKEALGKYFKTRVFGLVLLGICLLYLVNGQIYAFVGWLIDLFSGFLGF